ncbi:flagellin [Agrobacterium sp.]|jgi:flagellin-like hook-associated protein FlgL|uniref:flagellin N-terminal helical domain-containing protein n=1 Tax=Agrobacterium sp. TaxID=361 RepID=UPI0028AB99BE|nr:flagellin [Agrobacterium sp.]
MTSILTNGAAISALQTLRSVSSNMETTQRMVSTGLRVEVAADNAAYWSISTTMRSDNMAISTVSDALGLGAAKVDTAYEGTNSIVDVLKQFKARLVAAKEDGIDKSKIQEELKQLNDQAESIVASASFSGENWLNTTAATHLMETDSLSSSVVSAFVRSSEGSVAVKTSDVDLRTISMLNEGGGGILQKDLGGVADIGGFADANMNVYAHNGHETHVFTGPATFVGTDFIEFSVLVDAFDTDVGVTITNLRIDKSVVDAALGTLDGTINNAYDMTRVLQKVFDDNGVPLWAVKPNGFTSFGSDATRYEIGSLETSGHNGSSVDITGVNSSFTSGHPAGFGLGLEDTPSANHDNMFPKGWVNFTEPFTVSGLAEISFDVEVNGGGVQTLMIDKSVVDAALGTTDGLIGDRDAFATVLAYVTAGSGITVTSTDTEYPGLIVFMADPAIYPEAGNRAAVFNVSNVRTNLPFTLDFDLAEIDVTSTRFKIDRYIEGVEHMLKESISSAAQLGALSTRIDMQTEFADRLSNAIDSGIGRLVDADMNEASTRLKAIQTQQQLGIQTLSIANSNAEGVMQLFR